MADRAPDDLVAAVRAYADLCARNPGAIPSADVAWKLRAIVDGEPDAPVKYGASVRLRHSDDVRRAVRHLCARIIANAHLLDVPFTDVPDQSPWTLLKRDMARLKWAVGIPVEEENRG